MVKINDSQKVYLTERKTDICICTEAIAFNSISSINENKKSILHCKRIITSFENIYILIASNKIFKRFTQTGMRLQIFITVVRYDE